MDSSVCELLKYVRQIEWCDIAYARIRTKQTKPAIYTYLFDRNAPLCIMINKRNW